MSRRRRSVHPLSPERKKVFAPAIYPELHPTLGVKHDLQNILLWCAKLALHLIHSELIFNCTVSRDSGHSFAQFTVATPCTPRYRIFFRFRALIFWRAWRHIRRRAVGATFLRRKRWRWLQAQMGSSFVFAQPCTQPRLCLFPQPSLPHLTK